MCVCVCVLAPCVCVRACLCWLRVCVCPASGIDVWTRLVVQVWTDGTISPEEAVSRASGILVDSYSLMAKIANPEEFLPVVVIPEAEVEEATPQTPVEELKLSNRALNCLKRHGIDTVEQLVEISEDELFDLRGMGIKLVVELGERLAEVGLAVRGGELLSENGK